MLSRGHTYRSGDVPPPTANASVTDAPDIADWSAAPPAGKPADAAAPPPGEMRTVERVRAASEGGTGSSGGVTVGEVRAGRGWSPNGLPKGPAGPRSHPHLRSCPNRHRPTSHRPCRNRHPKPPPAYEPPASGGALRRAAPARGVARVPNVSQLSAADLPAELPRPQPRVYGTPPQQQPQDWPPPAGGF